MRLTLPIFILSAVFAVFIPLAGDIQPLAAQEMQTTQTAQAQTPAQPMAQAPSAAMAGDAAKGEKVFKKCAACHMVGPDAKTRLGPHLNNIIDGPIAVIDGFKYSKAMLAYAEKNSVWTKELLEAYLKKPAAAVPGGRMIFAGLKKASELRNLMAYLEQFTDDPESRK